MYIFNVREEAGDVSIEDLAKLVKGGAKVLPLDNVSPLLNYKDALLSLWAVDVQKYESALWKFIKHFSNNKTKFDSNLAFAVSFVCSYVKDEEIALFLVFIELFILLIVIY